MDRSRVKTEKKFLMQLKKKAKMKKEIMLPRINHALPRKSCGKLLHTVIPKLSKILEHSVENCAFIPGDFY